MIYLNQAKYIPPTLMMALKIDLMIKKGAIFQ